jgi:hypothetical protein
VAERTAYLLQDAFSTIDMLQHDLSETRATLLEGASGYDGNVSRMEQDLCRQQLCRTQRVCMA